MNNNDQRICTICNTEMSEGFLVDLVHDYEYYCSPKCLHEMYNEAQYKLMYEEECAYWTQWND